MSRTRTNTKMSVKKKLAALTSLVLVGALLIGGAFAWTDFSQSFINRFRGGVTPDVLLHDDFEPWLNKDVYVENTGEQDLIVRVKFNEFLQIGNKVIVGDDANDKDEWDTHLFTEAPEYGSGDPDSEDYGLCYDCALETHTYFQWYMTGAKKTYLHGTSEQGNEDWDGQSIEDPNNLGPNGMMFGETQDASEIMTMEQWIASDMSAACWVLDADGWAYWSQALAPTKATNLLLDNVKLIQKPDDNFYYAIDVILNATNITEAYKLENPTPEAVDKIITPITDKDYDDSGVHWTDDGLFIKHPTQTNIWLECDEDGNVLWNGDIVYSPNGDLYEYAISEMPRSPYVITAGGNFFIYQNDEWCIINPDGAVGQQTDPDPIKATAWDIVFSDISMETGEYSQPYVINITTPADSTSELRLVTSDKYIARITEDGRIFADDAGTATISLVNQTGEVFDQFEVTITYSDTLHREPYFYKEVKRVTIDGKTYALFVENGPIYINNPHAYYFAKPDDAQDIIDDWFADGFGESECQSNIVAAAVVPFIPAESPDSDVDDTNFGLSLPTDVSAGSQTEGIAFLLSASEAYTWINHLRDIDFLYLYPAKFLTRSSVDADNYWFFDGNGEFHTDNKENAGNVYPAVWARISY